ncbi:hypothetical protein H2199_000023 [Coniosporium tulheliwenetii]|uniref:Uncharacterized protein n=1 Tax=Coniosporium tulheliwenetii TaxID=3383036 RepID=A0ACC2ZP63_9PEZI|nr:hypothetical protein H2199_000023 [Cladosporium sp. JES 115]
MATDTPKIQQWESGQDSLDSLNLTSASMPEPGKDEWRRERSKIVPCSDCCGIVTKVGDGSSTSLKVGDRVLSTFVQSHLTGKITEKDMGTGLGLPLPGVLATHRVFPTHGLVKCPDYLSDEEACTLPIAAVTAWMSINGMRPLGQPGGKGEVVLVQGTGGVAISGVQIAKASDANVIITSSSDEKLGKARALGADHTINYRSQPEWQDEVMKITENHGADIILETGGAQTTMKSFDCVAFAGLINAIGYVSGKEDPPEKRLNINVLALRKNLTLKGIMNGPKDRFEEMLEFYEKHEIHPVVDRVFSFEEGKEAFQYLASGSHFGKFRIRNRQRTGVIDAPESQRLELQCRAFIGTKVR